MAIKVGGTTVIDDSRNVDNIGTIKGLTYPSSDGTAGQFLKTDGAGNLGFQTVQSDPTLGTLTKTFTNGESATITLTSSVSPTAVVAGAFLCFWTRIKPISLSLDVAAANRERPSPATCRICSCDLPRTWRVVSSFSTK